MRLFLLTLFVLVADESNLELKMEDEVCIQVIACGKDGKWYPNPCKAEKEGGGVDPTNKSCEEKSSERNLNK